MMKMIFTPADDLTDEIWGKIGTPERDAMEAKLKKDLHAYLAKEAIKNMVRKRQRALGTHQPAQYPRPVRIINLQK